MAQQSSAALNVGLQPTLSFWRGAFPGLRWPVRVLSAAVGTLVWLWLGGLFDAAQINIVQFMDGQVIQLIALLTLSVVSAVMVGCIDRQCHPVRLGIEGALFPALLKAIATATPQQLLEAIIQVIPLSV